MHGDMVVIYIRDHGELGPAVLQASNNLTPYGKEFCEPAEIRGYRATIARLPSPVETTVRIAVLVVERPIDWNKVLEAAKDGVRKGTRVWSCAVRFTNSSIDGSELYTPPGSLEGPSFGDVIVDEITALDVPVQIAVSFAGPVWSGWEHWSMTFSISSCPAFPSFAAFPGPQAPPTSAQPIPLTMASFERDMLEADTLEAQILSRLGEYREDPDAQRVVAEFAQWFDECFTSSVAASRITNLMGQGPVPTFAPPEVPSGPVVDGKVIASPVIFSDFEF